ncbi:ribosomal-processing cysteine protease Prp [Peptostreptococcus faecalis]|uniref:ribosomal-processing cysteine protease Prp n=1 Tax=Peptostreptococcus faecalis TaxID=2045015 RepID=UPI000C79B471|nr:ribosomal-processing cysteine protease Prp [Peptostreptococcus faecalis]
MIKVTFYYNSDYEIERFELKGHANYDDVGYDIVCSAATSNSLAVINSLDTLQGVKFKDVKAEEGYICCEVSTDDIKKSQLLLQHLRLALEEISKEYPKNIKLFEK